MRCNDCDLYIVGKCKNTLISGRGSKPSKTKYLIVQDCPTNYDDICETALTGDTKAKLNYFLEKAGIDYNEVYFTSALKCYVKEISKIKKSHIDECSKYLLTEIVEHRPEVIITMGKYAYKMLSDNNSIREFRGHFDEFEIDYNVSDTVSRTFKCPVMPTWGLRGSLMKWEYNEDIIRDFKKANQYTVDKILPVTPPPKVNTILTVKGLKDFVEKYREVKYATTDFETTGLDFWKDSIINSGYCSGDGVADIIFMSKYLKDHTLKWDKKEVERAKEINSFLKVNRGKCLGAMKLVHGFDNLKLILHNGKFDSKFATRYGMPYKNFWFDTMRADPLIEENIGHALNICMERRGINFGPYDTLLWGYINKGEKNRKSYQYVPPQLLEYYLGIDVHGCWKLFEKIKKELKEEGMVNHFMKTCMPSTRMVCDMEYTGVKYDKEALLKAGKTIEKAQIKVKKQLTELTGNEEFNPNSTKQVVDYMLANDYPLRRLDIKKNATGYSTAEEELKKLMKYKKYNKFPGLVIKSKKLVKLRGTYIDGQDNDESGGFLKHLDNDNYIHASFNLHSVKTSRMSCFRKGSKVDVVRDISKNPKGINIERVKIGDMVYCYDDDGGLAIREVTKTFDNGVKSLVRLHWRSVSGKTGYIDVTPEHGAGVWSGGYKRVDQLVSGDRLMFLSRCLAGGSYQQLNYKDAKNIKSRDSRLEHRFIMKHMTGLSHEVVHHIDHNKLNNSFGNLEGMTNSDHASHHAKERWLSGKMVNSVQCGEDNTNYYNWSKTQTLKVLARCRGRIKKSGYDFYTVEHYCDKYGIDTTWVRKRYNYGGQLINYNMALAASKMTLKCAHGYLRVGDVVCKEIFNYYGIKYISKPRIPPLNKGSSPYKKLSKYDLIKEVFNCKGKLLDTNTMPYKSLCRQLKDNSVDYVKMKYRFVGGRYINKGLLRYYDSLNTAPNVELGITPVRFLRLCDSHNYIPRDNHYVDYIEDIGILDNVYCLEVKDYHNFIVNEIKFSNCGSPSLQVFPRPVKGLPNTRNFIIPSSEDRILFECDYSALELKLVAAMSKDINMTKKIQDGIDLHCDNAITIGGALDTIPSWVTYDHMLLANDKIELIKDVDTINELMEDIKKHTEVNYKETRTRAKNLSFGLNYGQSHHTFAKDFNIPLDDSEDMVDAYFDEYYGLKAFRDKIVHDALNNGFITLPSGRKRRFHPATDWINSEYADGIWSVDFIKGEVERQAMNFPVQGGAHEIFEKAILRLTRRFNEEGIDARLLLLIHDGIVGECKRSDLEIVKKCMLEEVPVTMNKGTDFEIHIGIDVDFYERGWYGPKIKL
jgi:uracil-DNA glycosylase family 4